MRERVLIITIKVIAFMGFIGFAAFTALYALRPGYFSPITENSAFWYALGLAFMVTVTVLAFMVFLNPKKYWIFLIPPLAAGKITSSLSSLYLSEIYVTISWLKITVVTDGLIALIAVILIVLSYLYLRG